MTIRCKNVMIRFIDKSKHAIEFQINDTVPSVFIDVVDVGPWTLIKYMRKLPDESYVANKIVQVQRSLLEEIMFTDNLVILDETA